LSRCRTLAVAIAAMCAVIPITEAAAAKRSFGSRPLARPMKGPDVRTLQRLLTAWGLPLEIDGVYGRHTTLRVRSWERNSGRRINGRVSRRDARALQLAVERGERLPGSETETADPAPVGPGDKATLAPDGTAIAPASAPEAVKAIIAAGNKIHDYPYKYGGGHGSWNDSGYDCSGSMSYALHGAGLLDSPLDSTGFMRWGQAGKGRWVTTYANSGHSYMIVAGLRFDTSGRAEDDTRWHTDMRSSTGYTVRHPAGL
jgi:peptidoglycan hydrolase-like protein with peptidoglycan-binding domain